MTARKVYQEEKFNTILYSISGNKSPFLTKVIKELHEYIEDRFNCTSDHTSYEYESYPDTQQLKEIAKYFTARLRIAIGKYHQTFNHNIRFQYKYMEYEQTRQINTSRNNDWVCIHIQECMPEFKFNPIKKPEYDNFTPNYDWKISFH